MLKKIDARMKKPPLSASAMNKWLELYKEGRYREIELQALALLKRHPGFGYGWKALGTCLLKQGKDALKALEKAVYFLPDDYEALNSLSVAYRKKGRIDEAVKICRHALDVRPVFAGALVNLGHALGDNLEIENANEAYRKAFELDPANDGLEAAVWLAIRYYIDGNSELRDTPAASLPILQATHQGKKPAQIYRAYLALLAGYWQQSPERSNRTAGLPLLYVVGESHSLSTHRVVVDYAGARMRCHAQWILGCKQYHLGNGETNNYKYKFEAIMAALPRQSNVLLQFGEIDCRHDEGILKVWRKNAEVSPTVMAEKTANTYVDYVIDVASRYGHQLIVSAVPAPNAPKLALSAHELEQLISVIRQVNATLKNRALSAGLDYLDIYALSNRGDGGASGEWHLDEYHLQPGAMELAFREYCLSGRVASDVHAMSENAREREPEKYLNIISRQPVTLTTEQALQQAIASHRSGQLADAERLYRAILKVRPRHPDANHNLGVLAVQVKQPDAALPHFQVAVEANPGQGQYWLSYINALLAVGNMDEARLAIEKGVKQGLPEKSAASLRDRLRADCPPASGIADLPV